MFRDFTTTITKFSEFRPSQSGTYIILLSDDTVVPAHWSESKQRFSSHGLKGEKSFDGIYRNVISWIRLPFNWEMKIQ